MMTRITLTSTVEDALRVLALTDQPGVVVWERAAPVGVVTLADLSDAGVRRSPPGTLVEDVMSHECVALDPAADERVTEHRYLEAAWVSLQRRRPLSEVTLERRAGRDLRPPAEVPSDLPPDTPPSVRSS
jgi:hypothetical protein